MLVGIIILVKGCLFLMVLVIDLEILFFLRKWILWKFGVLYSVLKKEEYVLNGVNILFLGVE